jgi:hypothetical protein
MRQSTYLNVILTVNAGLLAAVVWTQLADRPLLAQDAVAQSVSQTAPASGVTTSADRQQKMIELLRDMNLKVEALTSTLQSGKLKVEVTNLKSGDVASAD